MKVLDLQCRLGHVFEGWFGSEDDFQGQRQRGLVQCPLCSDDHIEKRLSAPRLNLGASQDSGGSAVVSAATAGSSSPALPATLQSAWLELARKLVGQTEDVGANFAQEARRIHHGEAEERAIRGQATANEAVQLLEEGIAVVPLPVAAKDTLQ